MSQRPNHRRGEDRHQDNGPTYEGGPPNSGCNSTHVARSRAKWKRRNNRKERRTGALIPNAPFAEPRVRPEDDDEDTTREE